MKRGSIADQEQDEQQAPALSPHQVAQWIRNLDSQLLSIAGAWEDEALVLCYTFAVAGKVHPFCTKVRTAPLFSIADLYPAAAAFEAALQQQCGIVFQPYHREPDEP